MPCFEVRRVTVEFRAENKRLLEAAVEELGWKLWKNPKGKWLVKTPQGGITLDLKSGNAEFDDYLQGTVNKLKRSYSKQVVKKVAKLQGWSTRWGEYDRNGDWQRTSQGMEARVSR